MSYAGTEYQKLLDAVASYYGAGSDQWLTIATSSNIKSTEWAEILSNTPDVSVTYNKAGEIVSYTVKDSYGTATDAATAVINSNEQAATLAKASDFNVPANTTVSQGGTVAADSGMKSVATGSTVPTVMKNVALGVGAVAAGVQAGVKLDSALYNANPDMWDEMNLQTLNPQTWDSICTTEMGKTVFNFVFGIDKPSGETRAYMDERALAYMIQYLTFVGAFDGTVTPEPEIESGITIIGDSGGFWGGSVSVDNYNNNVNKIEITDYIMKSSEIQGDFPCYFTAADDTTRPEFVIVARDGNNHLAAYVFFNNDNTSSGLHLHDARDGSLVGSQGSPLVFSHVTYDNKTYQMHNWTVDVSESQYGHLPSINLVDRSLGNLIAAYGLLSTKAAIEGITKQTGATIPDIDPYADINDVLAALALLYPTMFDDAIYNDVIQQDGTLKRFRYVPVPIPDSVNMDEVNNILKVVGGTDLKQDDSTIDETSLDTILETLLEIVNATDPDNPTKTPSDVTTDFPDTGDGSTPAIVTPTGNASALYSVYNPTQAEINSFGAWLWSSNFVDQLLKLFNDPMQAIIGLHKIFASPPVSGRGNITVGYLSSGVAANLVSSQYTEVDCGTVSLREYFGNSLDYTNTEIYMYLPFVGIVPLNVTDVTRSRINVKYKVDVFTGACLATINVTRDNAGGQLYTYAGNCAVQYPISSGSYMGIVSGILGIAGSVAGTIASGGALLPMALGVGVSAMNNAKTKIEHSGSLSGNAGAMGIKKPYLIIRRPQTKIATNFETMNGVSNNVYGLLSSFAGYTRVKYVHLENIQATDNELTQIEELLKSGVMI